MYVRIARFEGGERNWDEFANEPTPAAGRGARTSVEIYEVLLDEELGG